MSEVPIPAASLERLRLAYGQFEQLCAVVAEAMNLPPGQTKQINLPGGVFVVDDGDATPQLSHEHANGVPA
jgi:hypothetical protein